MGHHAVMDDGLTVTAELVNEVIDDELELTRPKVDDAKYSAYERAAGLMRQLIAAKKFRSF